MTRQLELRRFLLPDVTVDASDAIRARINALESQLVRARRKADEADLARKEAEREVLDLQWALQREQQVSRDLQRLINRRAWSETAEQRPAAPELPTAPIARPEPTSAKPKAMQRRYALPELSPAAKAIMSRRPPDPASVERE